MTDLVDQMFPPINTKTAPAFTDFNFWRAPVSSAFTFDFPDLSPPSPALSARSESSTSRLPSFPRLGSLASSLSRRSSRQTLVEPPNSPNNRSTRGAIPSSPLLNATLVEGLYEDGEEYDDDRSESDSMPGSLPSGNDFERLRAAALRNGGEYSAAEEYKASVEGEYDSQDEEDEEGREEGGDDLDDQLDFSSVPFL